MLTTLFSHATTPEFIPDPIASEVIKHLIASACSTPSDFNLQPVRIIVVNDPIIKQKLHLAGLYHKPLLEAPCLFVFAADKDIVHYYAEDGLAADRNGGVLLKEEGEKQEKALKYLFGWKSSYLAWVVGAVFPFILRIFGSVPVLPLVHKRYWLAKQAMLACASLVYSADKIGLSCSISDILDESACKKALRLPQRFIIPAIVSVGYIKGDVRARTSFSQESMVHWNKWEGEF